MKQAAIYSLKVWFTGLALSLIGVWEYELIILHHNLKSIYYEITYVPAGTFVLSIAYAAPFFICVLFLCKTKWKILVIKLILSVLTSLLGWLPIMVLTIATDDLQPMILFKKLAVLTYIFLNCVCIWFYDIKQPTGKQQVLQVN